MSNKKKIALITGICGQDGAYLSEFLIKKKYKVYGFYKRSSSDNFWRLKRLNLLNKVTLLDIDLLEYNRVRDAIIRIKPNEIYNLAAQSFVGYSFLNPYVTTEINSLSIINLLETIKLFNNKIKFYQASTSEMFGNSSNKKKLNENSILSPESPYAVSKLYAHHLVLNYRKAYNLKLYSGILFNHESPLRGEEFVTRKITKGLIKYIKTKEKIKLGNIYSKRDWGYAKEYVDVMWRILNKDKSSTYAIGTGKCYSVKDFICECLNILNIDYKWVGNGLNEKCINNKDKSQIICIDKNYFRPSDVNYLKADISLAKKELKWYPKVSLKDLARIMIEEEIKYFN